MHKITTIQGGNYRHLLIIIILKILNKSYNSSVSPMPEFDKQQRSAAGSSGNNGMRPAVSLAQLCDLDPEEAPSSRGLIAQWENLIQQNA